MGIFVDLGKIKERAELIATWKILAWAEILLPDAPEEIKDRLVTYFDVEVKK